jgi:hypothetical protein
MTKKYFTLFPVFSLLVLSSGTAFAVNMPDKWGDQMERFKERVREEKNVDLGPDGLPKVVKEKREKLCNNIQGKMDERWAKYYDRRMERLGDYKNGTALLEKRIAFFKGKGLDTGTLETDVTTLTTLIGEYKTEYTNFLTLLEKAKTLPCANHEGEFLPNLKAAKDQWVIVKQKADTIRDYYKNTVKKHLQDLRAQLEVEITETEEE